MILASISLDWYGLHFNFDIQKPLTTKSALINWMKWCKAGSETRTEYSKYLEDT